MRQIAITYSGQGSQKPGMGHPWRDTGGWDVVGRATAATGVDVARLLLDASPEELEDTANVQLATLVLELVITSELRSSGALGAATIVGCAGHSLGEYSALAAAGVLSEQDVFRLVHIRGLAMAQACEEQDGEMAAVMGLDAPVVAELAEDLRNSSGDQVWVANVNSPQQLVLSGDPEPVQALCSRVREAGAKKVVSLKVAGAFHSPLMGPAAGQLAEALQEVRFHRASAPVVANVDAAAHRDCGEWRELLLEQLTAPVQWTGTLATLTGHQRGQLGADLLVEVGPGAVLTGLARKTLPDVQRVAVNKPEHLGLVREMATAAAAS